MTFPFSVELCFNMHMIVMSDRLQFSRTVPRQYSEVGVGQVISTCPSTAVSFRFPRKAGVRIPHTRAACYRAQEPQLTIKYHTVHTFL